MVDLFADVGIFDIEIVAAGLDLVDGDFPGLFGFDPGGKIIGFTAPPVDFGLELFKAHGLGFVVAFCSFRVRVFVIPDLFGGLAFAKKKEVGLDAGVGIEDAVGQADNGVQVALDQQLFLEPGLHAFAEEKTVGEDHGGQALGFEEMDDQGHEEVGGFPGAKGGGEIVFNTILLHAAKGWIGNDDIDPVFIAVIP